MASTCGLSRLAAVDTLTTLGKRASRGVLIIVDPRWSLPAAVFAVAVAARLGMIYAHGGRLHNVGAYDVGVYYAAGDALIHGRLPYHAFTLVHPPGVVLAVTPFAALGRWTSDHSGFIVATLAWIALGAANAVLVFLVGRRMSFGAIASAIGGFGYAVWYESTRAEFTLKLEPLGNFFVLLGILGFLASTRTNRRLMLIGSGAALGIAASVKIWYVVPLLVVLGWHVLESRLSRRAGWTAVGALIALTAINGPFFLAAPRQMWQMVVLDQLGRRRSGSVSLRVAEITSSGLVDTHSTASVVHLVAAIGGIVLLLLGLLALRTHPGRLVVILAIAQLVVIMAAPNFFLYYSDFLVPALTLLVAAAASAVLDRQPVSFSPARLTAATIVACLPVAAFAVLAVQIDAFRPVGRVQPAPGPALQKAVAFAKCVQSDSPMPLIELNVLSSDLANKCEVWVDVIGRSYAPPLEPVGRTSAGLPYGRKSYPPWQHALVRYLRSGDAVLVVEPDATGISRRTLRAINRGPVIARGNGYVVHRTS